MTAPAMPGTNFSQRTKRVFRIFTDQHGRKFQAWADSTNNQPIGELMPVGNIPPWQPPMRFAKWNASGELNFRWDYASMADELAATTASYYDDATKVAMQDKLPVPEIGGPVDRRIRSVIGIPPLSPALPLAAEAGDPWILGVPGSEPDDEIKAILNQGSSMTSREALLAIRTRVKDSVGDTAIKEVPLEGTVVTYQDFMVESRKRGMTMADIALAWRAHKDNLAEAA